MTEKLHQENSYDFIQPRDLANLGILYGDKANTQIQNTADFLKPAGDKGPELAVDYLFKLLRIEEKNLKTEKKEALKWLVNTDVMSNLDTTQLNSIVEFYEKKIRNPPYSYYELAQVYYTLNKRTPKKEYADAISAEYTDYIHHFAETTPTGPLKCWNDIARSHLKLPLLPRVTNDNYQCH